MSKINPTPMLGNIYALRNLDHYNVDPVKEDVAALNYKEFRNEICQSANNIIMVRLFRCFEEDKSDQIKEFVQGILRLDRLL